MAAIIGEVPRGFQAAPDDLSTSVLIPLMPQNGGAVGWGGVYLSFGTDFEPARLRIAVWSDKSKSWRVSTLDVPNNGGRVSVSILDGDSKVSVRREKAGPADSGQQPIGWLIEAVLRAA